MVACTSDNDCRDLQLVCNKLVEICVECVLGSDCDANEECEQGACTPFTTCTNSLDCVDDPLSRSICNMDVGECVECLTDVDCPSDNECKEETCESFTPCINSLDCPEGTVCDIGAERCVGCVDSNDCDDDETCFDSECRFSCDSDVQCVSMGLLCDRTLGLCVQCVRNLDCPDTHFCETGDCTPDVCGQGEERCTGNAVTTCTESGDGFSSPVPCGSSQSCSATAGSAACLDWVCTPGATECDAPGNVLETCSDDGLRIESAVSCVSMGQACIDDACQTQICTPTRRFCDGNVVKQCGGNGLTEIELETCNANEFCDGSSASCVTQICDPNQPACDQDVLRTCNADGSGFLPGGTDCTNTGQVCNNAMCTDPPPEEDACPGKAIALSGGSGSANGDLALLTPDEAATCGMGSPGADAVYRVTPAADGDMTVVVQPAGFDAVVHIRTTCASQASQVLCADANGLDGPEFVVVPVLGGTEYFIIVDSASTATGSYVLNVSF